MRSQAQKLNLHLTVFRMAKRAHPIAFAAVAVLALGPGYRLLHTPAAPIPKSMPPAIPVQTALAQQTDVPIYLDGLGTVQAFNTITLTTRVDGQLQAVDFAE